MQKGERENKTVGKPLESKKQCERALRSIGGGDRKLRDDAKIKRKGSA